MDSNGNRTVNVAQSSITPTNASQHDSLNDHLPILRDYDAILAGSLTAFVTVSQKIAGDLTGMIEHVTRLFAAQQQFVRQALGQLKPVNDQQIMELIRPQSTEIEAICGKTNVDQQ
jgi:hypothetical protein